ncbi:MAG: pyruvate dehydrogenase complex dihydrolipoamide acetyltransferase [Chitinophagaceae bacterium]|nr:pyruvate dehydrogenase complex dihydrolipoamide acetyltransferase [Chitinophagaceae bacterium]
MAEVILMPRLSDTMTEGVIAAWHKKVGDIIKKGDLLAEIETDKATMELESYKDGTLLHIGSEKGGKLQVDDLLAIVGKPGEDISSLLKGAQKSEVKTEKKEEPVQKMEAQPQTSNPKPQTSSLDVSKMDEVVLMPRLSDTMEEGVIASWHKNVGDAVKKGEVLADIETDKATMELESYKNGTLLYIGAQKGEKIPVNALLCIIGEKANVDVDAIIAAVKPGVSQKSEVKSEKKEISSQQKSQPSVAGTTITASQQTVTSNENGRVKASPLAKKLAKEKGVDLKLVHGSGDGGRITKSDIDSFKEPGVQRSESEVNTTIPIKQFDVATAAEGYTDIPNSQIRGVIAKRLGESKFSAPHFYLTMEINMDNAISARTQLNEVSPVKISFNDLVIKAAALALRQHPAVNASWLGDKIRRWSHIHIGVAVAIEDGLIVPVVRFADQKSLPQIAGEAKELAGKAKSKKLQPNEFTGNTFTISNLGMMDIDEFTAIINPPDSCIMAVGKIKEVVVKKPEGFGVSNMMKITLSCDHRSVDGATGAAFLQTFKKYLENPVMMLL